jgi:hypothetical protein
MVKRKLKVKDMAVLRWLGLQGSDGMTSGPASNRQAQRLNLYRRLSFSGVRRKPAAIRCLLR